MIDPLQAAAGQHVFVAGHLGEVTHRRTWHAGGEQPVGDFLFRHGFGPGLDNGIDLEHVLHAGAAGRVARIVQQVGAAESRRGWNENACLQVR